MKTMIEAQNKSRRNYAKREEKKRTEEKFIKKKIIIKTVDDDGMMIRELIRMS